MIVDCGERMLRMLQIAQRRLQVLSDPRARLLSHTDAAALVICSDNRRAGREESPGTTFINAPTCRIRSACCARATSGHAAALPCPAMNSCRRILDPRADQRKPTVCLVKIAAGVHVLRVAFGILEQETVKQTGLSPTPACIIPRLSRGPYSRWHSPRHVGLGAAGSGSRPPRQSASPI
jgi:hypothetical protein